MKKPILFLLFIIISFNYSLSQNKSSDIKEDGYSTLKLIPSLSDDEKMILLISYLKSDYCDFKYKAELLNNQFHVEKVSDGYNLKIYSGSGINSYNKTNEIIKIRKIKLNKQNLNGDAATDSELIIMDSEKYISQNYSPKETSISALAPPGPISQNLIVRNNIFIDKDILLNIITNGQTRILNRTVTQQNLHYPNSNSPAYLFSYISDAAIIPDGNGDHPKIFLVDDLLAKIQYFNNDFVPSYGEPFFRRFGQRGTEPGQFQSPAGITYGDFDATGFRNIYVAEFAGKRLQHLGYKFQNNSHIWYTPFNAVMRNFDYELYDIVFNKGRYLNDQNDDVLWVAEENPNYMIRCLKASDASDIIPPINSFNIRGRNVPIGLGKMDVYSDYVNGEAIRSMLAYVSNGTKSVILAHLSQNNYLPSSNPPDAFAVINVPGGQSPTSVKFISGLAGTADPVGIIITSNDANNQGYIHRYKIIFSPQNNQFIIPTGVEYLGSTPTLFKKNSISEYSYSPNFMKLTNLESQINFCDIYTIEEWDDNYGIRRMKQAVDIQSFSWGDSYCRNSGINFNIRLTNPAKAYIDTYYQPYGSNSFTPRAAYINGIQTHYASLTSGSNSLSIRVNTYNVKSISKTGESGLVKIVIHLLPIDETDFIGSYNQVSIEKLKGVSECNSPGGCPFVYVFDGNDFQQDNNILHKSELPENAGKDIQDKYLLSVYPQVDNRTIQLN